MATAIRKKPKTTSKQLAKKANANLFKVEKLLQESCSIAARMNDHESVGALTLLYHACLGIEVQEP